ncbi:MAG: hypothetical protein NVSMB38_44910 [Ktedonobacteraceae bacterium]
MQDFEEFEGESEEEEQTGGSGQGAWHSRMGMGRTTPASP